MITRGTRYKREVFKTLLAASAATTVRELKPATTALGLLDGNAKRSEFSEEIALTIVLAPNVASVYFGDFSRAAT